jgi:type VI protein secretion system component VasF
MSAMAQTKRKRRTKHRGNAAGSIEVRGRTGRKLTAEEQKRATARDRRARRPPSWSSAFYKALAMAVLLFALTRFHILTKGTTLSQSILLSVFALVFYTPLAYATDKWTYTRLQKQREKNA